MPNVRIVSSTTGSGPENALLIIFIDLYIVDWLLEIFNDNYQMKNMFC